MLKLRYTLIIIIITILAHANVFAQHHISAYEFRWAVLHPFAALKIRHRLPKAMIIYNEVRQEKLLDDLNSGGKLDAFRHTYTMAYLARHINVKKLRKLGIAHEKGNKKQFKKNKLEEGERPDSLACEMDLKNNELGFLIGAARSRISDEELKTGVVAAIKEGKAWYLRRNEHLAYLTCSGEPIEMGLYKEKWYVPKCLIKTNE